MYLLNTFLQKIKLKILFTMVFELNLKLEVILLHSVQKCVACAVTFVSDLRHTQCKIVRKGMITCQSALPCVQCVGYRLSRAFVNCS